MRFKQDIINISYHVFLSWPSNRKKSNKFFYIELTKKKFYLKNTSQTHLKVKAIQILM